MLSTPGSDPRPGLALEIRATESHLLVGEPLLLEGRATSSGRATFHDGSMVVLSDHGSGFAEVSPRLALAEDTAPQEIAPGVRRDFEVEVVFDIGATDTDPLGNWVFATPGSYRIVVEHRLAGAGVSRSNAVTVAVSQPTGDDATVFAQIGAHRDAWDFLSYQHAPGDLPASLKALLTGHPHSPYLQRARFQQIERWAVRAQRGCDPEGVEPCFSPPAVERAAAIRQHAASVIPRIQPMLVPGNPWAAEALRTLSYLQSGAGDQAGHIATLQRLAREFPDRNAGRWAIAELQP